MLVYTQNPGKSQARTLPLAVQVARHVTVGKKNHDAFERLNCFLYMLNVKSRFVVIIIKETKLITFQRIKKVCCTASSY